MVKYCQVLLVVAVMTVVVVAGEEGARRDGSKKRAKDKKPGCGTSMCSLRENIEKLQTEFKNKNWTAPVKGPINNIKPCSSLLQPPQYCPTLECRRDVMAHITAFKRPLASVRKVVEKSLSELVRNVESALKKMLADAQQQCQKEAIKGKSAYEVSETKSCARRIDKHLKNAEEKEKGQMLVVLMETLLHHLTPKADDATTTQQPVQTTTTTGTTTGTTMDKWQAFQPDDEEAPFIRSLQNKAKNLTQLLNNTSDVHTEKYNRSCGDVFRTMRQRDVCRCETYVDCRRFVISRVTSLRTPLEALKNGTETSNSATDTLASSLSSMHHALDDLLKELDRQCTAKTQKYCKPKAKTSRAVKKCVKYIQTKVNTGNGDLKTEVVFGFSKHMESFAKQFNVKPEELQKMRRKCNKD